MTYRISHLQGLALRGARVHDSHDFFIHYVFDSVSKSICVYRKLDRVRCALRNGIFYLTISILSVHFLLVERDNVAWFLTRSILIARPSHLGLHEALCCNSLHDSTKHLGCDVLRFKSWVEPLPIPISSPCELHSLTSSPRYFPPRITNQLALCPLNATAVRGQRLQTHLPNPPT